METAAWLTGITALLVSVGIPAYKIWSASRDKKMQVAESKAQAKREHSRRLYDSLQHAFEALGVEHKTLQEKYMNVMIENATLKAEAAARRGLRDDEPIAPMP